jgi:hypothetical protein
MKAKYTLSRSWRITWKHKYLWFFGFLAALSLGYWDNENPFIQGGVWLFSNLDDILNIPNWLALVIFIIALALWTLGLIGRCSLIYEVAARNSLSRKPMKKIGPLFKMGVRSLSNTVLMQLLIWSPILILTIVTTLIAQPFTQNVLMVSENSIGSLPNAGNLLIVWGLSMITGLLSIPITLIATFAFRAIVLEELLVIPGIQRAVQIIKDNLADIIVFSLIYLVLAFIAVLILGIALLPLLFTIAPRIIQSMDQCNSLASDVVAMNACIREMTLTPSFITKSLGIGVLGAALSSIWITFQSTSFTLLYNKLTQKR